MSEHIHAFESTSKLALPYACLNLLLLQPLLLHVPWPQRLPWPHVLLLLPLALGLFRHLESPPQL